MKTDRKAVFRGALVGAATTFAVIAFGGRWVDMIIVSAVVASPPAGVVAAYTSTERMRPFDEGAFASVLGLVLGVLAWMVFASVLSPLHPLDGMLLLFPFALISVSLGFVISFFIGGFFGYRTLMSWT